jgi:hypothetical protein
MELVFQQTVCREQEIAQASAYDGAARCNRLSLGSKRDSLRRTRELQYRQEKLLDLRMRLDFAANL